VEAAAAAADAALAEVARPAPGVAEIVVAADEPAQAPAAGPGGEVRGHSPFGRPAGLAGPRDGRKDDLLQIRGLTPQSEAALNAIGIFHFDQIAAWDKKAALWIDNHLALKGSLARDKWVEQARELARARGPGFRAAIRH
jgi:NADH-quinone oxidoreductase subunit E